MQLILSVIMNNIMLTLLIVNKYINIYINTYIQALDFINIAIRLNGEVYYVPEIEVTQHIGMFAKNVW